MQASDASTSVSKLSRTKPWWHIRDPAWVWVLMRFLIFRVLLTIWAAWISYSHPKPEAPQETAISIVPGSAPLDQWLARTVLWPSIRYDTLWYLSIAEHGYGAQRGDTAYHPLYPILIR